MYCLQVGYCQSGGGGPQVFAGLRKTAWEPSALEHLLGSSNYLCGIVAGKNDELAAQALAAFAGEKPGQVIFTHLHKFDSWLYGVSERLSVVLLFYPDAEREAQAGDALLNNRAPRLEVYKHKIDHQLTWCEQNLSLLSAQSRALNGLLDEFELDSSVGDKTLARQLARQFRVYESNLEMLSERQMTVETNLHNLDVVLQEFGALAEDRLLNALQERLWERRQQLEEMLDQARSVRGRAEAAIRGIVTRLGLKRPADLLEDVDDATRAEGLIPQGGFPGVLPPYEADLPFPQIESTPGKRFTWTRLMSASCSVSTGATRNCAS